MIYSFARFSRVGFLLFLGLLQFGVVRTASAQEDSRLRAESVLAAKKNELERLLHARDPGFASALQEVSKTLKAKQAEHLFKQLITSELTSYQREPSLSAFSDLVRELVEITPSDSSSELLRWFMQEFFQAETLWNLLKDTKLNSLTIGSGTDEETEFKRAINVEARQKMIGEYVQVIHRWLNRIDPTVTTFSTPKEALAAYHKKLQEAQKLTASEQQRLEEQQREEKEENRLAKFKEDMRFLRESAQAPAWKQFRRYFNYLVVEPQQEYAESEGKRGGSPYFLLNEGGAIETLLNDAIEKARVTDSEEEWIEPQEVDEYVDDLVSILSRRDIKFPVLTGTPGIGKRKVLERFAIRAMESSFPAGRSAERLNGALVLVTNPGQLVQSARKNQIEESAWIQSLLAQAYLLNSQRHIPLVIVIDEIERLSVQQAEGLERVLKTPGEKPLLILMGQSLKTLRPPEEYTAALAQAKQNQRATDSLLSFFQEVKMKDYSADQKVKIIEKAYLKRIANSHFIRAFDADVTRAAVEQAQLLNPNAVGVQDALKLLEDVALEVNRRNKGRASEVTMKDFYAVVAKKAKLKAVPQDTQGFQSFLNDEKKKLKSRFPGKERVIDQLVDDWGAKQRLNGKLRHTSSLLASFHPTESAELIQAVGTAFFDERVLTLDLASLTSEHEISNWFGAPASYVGYGEGNLLCSWVEALNGKSGMIVIQNLDRATASIFAKLSPAIKDGRLECGGKKAPLSQSMLVFTTGKGMDHFYTAKDLREDDQASLERIAARISRENVIEEFTKGFAEKDSARRLDSATLSLLDRITVVPPLSIETAVAELQTSTAQDVLPQLLKSFEGTQVSLDPSFVKTLVEFEYGVGSGLTQIRKRISDSIGDAVKAHLSAHPKSKSLRLSIQKDENLPHLSQIVSSDTETGQTSRHRGPQKASSSAFYDDAVREHLSTLEARVGQQVLGQPELVSAGVRLYKNRIANPNDPSPSVLFAFGPTGTGKTELGKAIAKHAYRDEEAILIQNLANFTFAAQYQEWLNPAQNVGAFENFLKKYAKKGGVFVLDEASNIGGGMPIEKIQFSKMLYDLLQEGKWTSRATGTAYDIRNIFFELTGNTGEELFFGITAEDIQMNTWQSYGKDPRKMRELLRADGFTAAMLGRIPEIVLVRPQMKRTRIELVQKAFDTWHRQMSEAYPSFKFVPSQAFMAEVAKLVYSPDTGARSIEAFLKSEVSPLVSEGIEKIDFKSMNKVSKVVIELDVTSISPTKFYYENEPSKKEALLHVRLTQNGRELFKGSRDFTDKALFARQMTIVDAWRVAFHEMGHAVTNKPSITGLKTRFVSIVPGTLADGRSYNGVASSEHIEDLIATYDREAIVTHGAMYLAGYIAEELLGIPEPGTGRSSDLEMFKSLIVQAGQSIEPDLAFVRFDEKNEPIGPPHVLETYHRFMKDMFEASANKAREVLREHWVLVYMGAKKLAENGNINGDEFYALVNEYKTLSAEKKAKLASEYTPERTAIRFNMLKRRCSNALTAKRFDVF